MTAFNDIRAAIESEIANITGIPTVANRAWENVKFKPTTGTAWVRTTLVPGESRPAVIGSDPQLRYIGLAQIDVFMPEGNGAKDADELADNIRLAFKPGTELTSGSTTVLIQWSERRAATLDGPWYQVPVTISWLTFRK